MIFINTNEIEIMVNFLHFFLTAGRDLQDIEALNCRSLIPYVNPPMPLFYNSCHVYMFHILNVTVIMVQNNEIIYRSPSSILASSFFS